MIQTDSWETQHGTHDGSVKDTYADVDGMFDDNDADK